MSTVGSSFLVILIKQKRKKDKVQLKKRYQNLGRSIHNFPWVPKAKLLRSDSIFNKWPNIIARKIIVDSLFQGLIFDANLRHSESLTCQPHRHQFVIKTNERVVKRRGFQLQSSYHLHCVRVIQVCFDAQTTTIVTLVVKPEN